MDIKALDNIDPIVDNRPITEEDLAVFRAAFTAYRAAKKRVRKPKIAKKELAPAM